MSVELCAGLPIQKENEASLGPSRGEWAGSIVSPPYATPGCGRASWALPAGPGAPENGFIVI